MDKQRKIWMQRRRRISEIIEVGKADDWVSRSYDIVSTLVLLINVAVTVLYTFDKMELFYGEALLLTEAVTVAFFAVDYFLRVWTACFMNPGLTEGQAIKKYVLSFTGIIDLFSFLPYYLPIFFPGWRGGFPPVPGCANFPVVPDQCIL